MLRQTQMNDVARIEMKDDDGAQAQAMQVRFRGAQGRASLDGAPLHPLRPPASMLTVWLIVDNKIKGVTLCSHVPGRFTHTHTHSLTHTHTHATTHSLARSFAHSFLSHPRNRTIITVTQACTHKRTDAYTQRVTHGNNVQESQTDAYCHAHQGPHFLFPISISKRVFLYVVLRVLRSHSAHTMYVIMSMCNICLLLLCVRLILLHGDGLTKLENSFPHYSSITAASRIACA